MSKTNENTGLSSVAGKWTIKGLEDRFVESCEMYPGGHFLVCNSEFKTESGETNKGVSIIGNPTGTDQLTYYHYGSSGASRSLKGKINKDGSLYFEGEEVLKGKLTRVRINMKKAGENFDFKEEVSVDGEQWETITEIIYVRIKE